MFNSKAQEERTNMEPPSNIHAKRQSRSMQVGTIHDILTFIEKQEQDGQDSFIYQCDNASNFWVQRNGESRNNLIQEWEIDISNQVVPHVRISKFYSPWRQTTSGCVQKWKQ